MRYAQDQKIDSNLIFREDFTSVKHVSDNGGTITGTPTIDGTARFTAGSDYIDYSAVRPRGDLTKMAVRWKGSVALDVTYQTVFNINNGGVAYGDFSGILRNAATSRLQFAIADGVSYARVNTGTIVADRVYDIVGVWNGGSDVLVYVDGVLSSETPSSSGIPGTITADDMVQMFAGAMEVGSYNGTSTAELIELYDTALTAEEVKDLYERDTYAELERPVIDLPLRSWYYKENGVELLTDGDMETAGVAAWSVGGSATLTKETGTRTGGTGSQILRVAYNGVSTPLAYQAILTVGKRYKVNGWARGDGVKAPKVYLGTSGAEVWTGAVSTTWQNFAFEYVVPAGENNRFALACNTSAAGYAEFDDVTVELMEAQTENKGTAGGTATLGNGTTTSTFPTQLSPKGMSFDGGDYIRIDSTGIDLSSAGSMGCLFTFDDFDSGLERQLIATTINTNNRMSLMILDGDVRATMYNGSHNRKSGAITDKGIHTAIFTWDGVTANLYIDGVLQSGSNTATSSPTAGTVIGANSNIDDEFIGTIKSPFIYSYGLTPAQVRKLHHDMLNRLNV